MTKKYNDDEELIFILFTLIKLGKIGSTIRDKIIH